MASTIRILDASLSARATEGMRHLQSADWSDSVAPVEEWCALVALRYVLAGYLVGSVDTTTDQAGKATITVTLDGSQSGISSERYRAANGLMDPLKCYLDLADIVVTAQRSDTGLLPIPVLVIGAAVGVAIVAAQAYLGVTVVSKAAEIVDNCLRRKDAAKELQRADAEVLKLVNNHVQAEQKEGKALPLDAATKAALDGLESRIGVLTKNSFEQRNPEATPPTKWWLIGILAAGAAVAVAVAAKKGTKNV